MITSNDIKLYTGIKDDSQADKLAEEINKYSSSYKIGDLQIVELLKKYKSTPLEQLKERKIELKVKTNLLKSELQSKILEE